MERPAGTSDKRPRAGGLVSAEPRAELRVAVVGNPNSGKTTLFNALTGLHQKVGNYPGVTVEKKEGVLRYQGTAYRLIDLPGAYSATCFSACWPPSLKRTWP
jgi:small GTP-binding protein